MYEEAIIEKMITMDMHQLLNLMQLKQTTEQTQLHFYSVMAGKQ
jgi:hypothetical protein